MTEPKSLREKLQDQRDEAAKQKARALTQEERSRLAAKIALNRKSLEEVNAYLLDFAANFEDKIATAVVKHDTHGQPFVVFSIPAMRNVDERQVQATQGYQKLKEVCKSDTVDMCLGFPDSYSHSTSTFGPLAIFIGLPYSASVDALFDKGIITQREIDNPDIDTRALVSQRLLAEKLQEKSGLRKNFDTTRERASTPTPATPKATKGGITGWGL